MVASNNGSLAEKKFFVFFFYFTCSKATVFTGPCMAIIFCTLLTYKDLVVV